MKNLTIQQAFAALALTAATVAISPAANAAETKAVENLQSTRLEFLNSQTKAVDDIQATRLTHLDTQTKSIKDIQTTRLEFLNNQTKAVDDIQSTRLAHLDSQTQSRPERSPASPRRKSPS